MLYWATDKVLIGAMLGSAAVAVYNIGGTFTAMLQNMALSISGVFSPRVNIMVANNESNDALSELLIRIGRLQYLLISLILSGYIVFGQDFIRLWAGPEYSDAYYVALLTMIPLSVPLIQNIAFAILMARNKHQFRSIMYAIVAVINLVSTWLVLPYFGIIGAAVCTAAAFVLGNGIIMNIYYYRVTGLDIPKFWGNILKMSIVPAIMIALGLVLLNTVLPVSSLWVFLGYAAGFTVIFCLLSWLVSMNRYEKDLILSILRKFLPKKS
jgi:O-antigen/teichoic acid export membrane protein